MQSEYKNKEQQRIQLPDRSYEHQGHDPGQRSGDEAYFTKGKKGKCIVG